jgi:septal ring-binding cell division protein DamX
VAFAPIVLDRKDTVVPLSSYPVELRQLYPLYTGERVRIDSEGLDWFLEVDGLNPHDVKRKDFSAAVPAGKASKKPAPAAKAKPVAAAKAPAKPAKAPAKPAKAPAKPAKAPVKPAKAPAKPAKAPAKPAKTDKAKAAKKPAAKAKKKAR